MSKHEKRTISADEIEEDMQKLEHGIRRLRIQYEQFFGGGLKREPVMLRGSVHAFGMMVCVMRPGTPGQQGHGRKQTETDSESHLILLKLDFG